jgi:hypothetical protein
VTEFCRRPCAASSVVPPAVPIERARSRSACEMTEGGARRCARRQQFSGAQRQSWPKKQHARACSTLLPSRPAARR